MAYTPTYYEKDGVIRLARTQSEAIALRFAGWSVFAGDININPQGKVVSFNGRSGVVTLTAADILATGFAGGASDPESIRDTIGIALQGTGLITVTVDDDGNMLTVSTTATQNSTDATLLNRTNHTGTQSADTIVDGTTNHTFTAADDTKLTGIATGATANSSDTFLRARTNHTGSQLAATISDFNTAVSGAISGAGYAPSVDPTFTGLTTISGFRLGQLSKSADYTVAANDPSYIAVATGAGNVTITLPAAAPAGTIFIIKKTDGNGGNVTISANTDAFTIPSLNSQYDVMGLISTGAGSNYSILFSNKPVRIQASTTDLGTVLSNLGMRTSGSAYPITTSGAVAFSGGFAALANLRLGAKAISAAYTITTTDPLYILANATTAAFAVTLPSITTSGITYLIKKTDSTANAVTMTSMFDGQAGTTIALGTRGDYVMIESTSTADQWIVVGSNRPMPGQQQGATVDLGVVLSNLGLRGSGTAYTITTSGALGLTGSTRFGQRNISSGTTLSSSTDPYFITVDGTTAAFNLTLPSATTVGQTYSIKKSDSVNPVTIVGTIDGATNLVLTSKDDFVTVVSAGGGGSAWRIVARSAPNLVPSYVTAPALLRKSFDPNTGLYNLNARTMKKARAGLGRAGVGGKMQAVFLGDSTMIGFDGTATIESNSYPRRVQNAITQLTGIRSAGTGFVPAVANNDRWGFTGTVDRVTYPGLCTIFPSSTATYTSVIKGTSVEAIYSNQSNAGGTITIDGGAPISLPVTGAATLRREVLATGLADTTHTVVFTPASGGYIFLSHVAIRHSTGLEFHNLSVGGTMADFGTATTNWSSVAAAPTTKTSVLDPITAYITDPDLFVIAIGGNDLYNGDTNVHAIAGAKKLRDIYPNASIIMIQGWRLGVVPAATANDYLERKYNLADQYDFAVHDFQAYSGTLEEATALSLLGADSAHPKNEAVYGWGLSTGKALAS